MKHYVITGGAGFIGSHLTEKLLERGERVTVIDNLVSGSQENVDIFVKKPNYTFVSQDVRQPLTIEEKVDFVCNLACPASPPHYFTIPIETLETSAAGTKNALDLAKKHQARFFHTSTSEVYGNPTEHPQKESYFGNVEPYAFRSCYDEGKRYAEALIFSYRQLHKLDTGIVRIFNTYGPRMRADDGRVVTNFINQALRNEPITMYGDGQQTRSFCYVSDQVAALDKLINSDIEGPINVGNPEEVTMLELARLIIKLTNSKSKIIFGPPALSDPSRRCPDITKAKKLLDWQPTVSLETGLAATIKFFQSQQ